MNDLNTKMFIEFVKFQVSGLMQLYFVYFNKTTFYATNRF